VKVKKIEDSIKIMQQEEIVTSDVKKLAEGENALDTHITESIFQSIIIACLRHKQLKNGANPRIIVPSLKTKNTRIAIEEVKQGLIHYSSILDPLIAKV
jgi:DNA-directed RNA polymerase subunit K/omega